MNQPGGQQEPVWSGGYGQPEYNQPRNIPYTPPATQAYQAPPANPALGKKVYNALVLIINKNDIDQLFAKKSRHALLSISESLESDQTWKQSSNSRLIFKVFFKLGKPNPLT